MAHVADGAHGDGWARSARLAFEKSPRRPAGRSPRPNLPYTRANKRLHLALKKHAEGERVTRPWHEAEDRGGGNPQGDGDGVEGGGGTMQPDASYSHLRGRTRGPLPLLYHYARAGKTSRLVGRGGWGEEKDGTEGGGWIGG